MEKEGECIEEVGACDGSEPGPSGACALSEDGPVQDEQCDGTQYDHLHQVGTTGFLPLSMEWATPQEALNFKKKICIYVLLA